MLYFVFICSFLVFVFCWVCFFVSVLCRVYPTLPMSLVFVMHLSNVNLMIGCLIYLLIWVFILFICNENVDIKSSAHDTFL